MGADNQESKWKQVAFGATSLVPLSMVVVSILGIVDSLMKEPVDWILVGKFVTFGIPWTVGLIIILGRNSTLVQEAIKTVGTRYLLIFVVTFILLRIIFRYLAP